MNEDDLERIAAEMIARLQAAVAAAVEELTGFAMRIERKANEDVQRAIGQQLRPAQELAAAIEPGLRAGHERLGVVFQDAVASIRSERDAALEAIRAERGKP